MPSSFAERPRLARSKKLLFGFILTAGFFLVAEGALRIVGLEKPPPIRFELMNPTHESARQSESIFREHPELFWELRPGFPDRVGRDTPNVHTFRGPAYEREKPPGTFRVAALGDSCTYGVELSLDQTYARRLEDFLARAHPEHQVEVINAGVHAYSIYQGRVALEQKVLPFDPDIVVLYFGGFNDGKFALGASDLQRGLDREELARSSWTYRLTGALEGLHLYRAMTVGLDAARHAVRDAPTSQDVTKTWLKGRPIYGVRVPSDEFEILLDQMLDLCRGREAVPILVLPELNRDFIEQEWYPDWGERHLHYLELYRGILERAAAERQVLTVDQRELYAPFEDSREVYLPKDPVHPDGNGNLILAWALFETIESLGAIDQRIPSGRAARHRAFDCDRVHLTPHDRQITWKLDAGPEYASGHYVLIPSTRAARLGWGAGEPKIRLALEIDALTRFVLDRPGLAAASGWIGRLDDEGRARVAVQLPERIFEIVTADFIGFVFVASRMKPGVEGLQPGQDMVSNDCWLAVDDARQ